MLSILIPTYNYNVYPLVKSLHSQAIEANIIFEILSNDDGSKSALNLENQKINDLEHCSFFENENNVGLSNNRNDLVEKSKYENLLFIDGDSVVIKPTFLSDYLKSISEDFDVVYGGRVHPESVDNDRKLRWKYGKFREDRTVNQRNKSIYKSVLFNNTLIKLHTFKKIGFEKSLIKYGHEDTLFAYQLSNIKAKVKHIDNPILHGDVDLNIVYIEKTKKALNNLNYIYKSKLIAPDFITFLSIFLKLKQFGVNYPLAFTYRLTKSFFVANLKSKHPSLIVFDLFRLTYFCHINIKE